MERPPSFEKIIGGTDKQIEKIRRRAEQASLKTGEELFGEYLIEPTREEKESIEQAVAYANDVAAHYGASRQFGSDRIFLLEPGGVAAVAGESAEQAICNSFDQSIGVDRFDSNAILAARVVHEMFHMDGYHSAQVEEKKLLLFLRKTDSQPYRSGIAMTGRKGEGNYFGLAEEAIIATLSRRFFDEVITHDPLYREEVERTVKIKEWLISYAQKHIPEQERRNKFIAGVQDILILPKSAGVYRILYETDNDDNFKIGYFRAFFEENLRSGTISHERAEEREKFDMVLDRIVAASQGKIASRDELFDQFARAHFTGNYLSLARMVEDVLGKGAFREIAIELGEMNDTK